MFPAMKEEQQDDSWTTTDKYYHVIFTLTLTLFFSLLISHTRHPLLRRNSTLIAVSLSLFAGAAKEFADYLGYFHSSGASVKDGVADIIGVVIALLLLRLRHRKLTFGERVAGVEIV